MLIYETCKFSFNLYQLSSVSSYIIFNFFEPHRWCID